MNEVIAESLEGIIQQVGLGILEDPLRLDAFLRDLHPDRPAEVSVVVESLFSGVVEQFLRRTPIHECKASLSARGGVTPSYADWVMHVWDKVLPDSAMLEQEHLEIGSQHWDASVEEVLGTYRDGS